MLATSTSEKFVQSLVVIWNPAVGCRENCMCIQVGRGHLREHAIVSKYLGSIDHALGLGSAHASFEISRAWTWGATSGIQCTETESILKLFERNFLFESENNTCAWRIYSTLLGRFLSTTSSTRYLSPKVYSFATHMLWAPTILTRKSSYQSSHVSSTRPISRALFLHERRTMTSQLEAFENSRVRFHEVS